MSGTEDGNAKRIRQVEGVHRLHNSTSVGRNSTDIFACVYENIYKRVIVNIFKEVSGIRGKMKEGFHVLGKLYYSKCLNKNTCIFSVCN